MRKVKIIFGTEQVRKIENGGFLFEEEKKINTKEYIFESEKEEKAFIFGMEEIIGWQQYLIFEN